MEITEEVIPTYQEHERAGYLRECLWSDLILYIREVNRTRRVLEAVTKVLEFNVDPANQPPIPAVSEFGRGYREGVRFAYEDIQRFIAILLTEESDPG